MTETDRHESEAKPSSLSGLSAYPSNPYQISEVACQECEAIRPGIKRYTVIHIFCLIFFAYWRLDIHLKCPRCMRRYLCRRILPALLLSNFASPIVLFWWGILFLRTFLR